jgi:hypothetical protein
MDGLAERMDKPFCIFSLRAVPFYWNYLVVFHSFMLLGPDGSRTQKQPSRLGGNRIWGGCGIC